MGGWVGGRGGLRSGLVVDAAGLLSVFKVPSVPGNQAEGVINAVDAAAAE